MKTKKEELIDFGNWLIEEKYCLENPMDILTADYLKLKGEFCECDLVVIIRDQETQIPYCGVCEKKVKEE